MSRRTVYIILISISLVLLTSFILFGPGGEKKKKQSFLWEKSWEIIEYVPPEGSADRSEKKIDIKKKFPEKGKKKKRKRDPNRGKILIRFEKNSGLFEDSFSVTSPRGGIPKSPLVKRRGNNTVKNIFNDWGKPRLKGVYEFDEKRIEKLGITPDSAKLKLFSSKSAKSVVITMSEKTRSGKIYFTTNLSEHRGLVFVGVGYVRDKFSLSYKNFRESRLLIYPSKSYTEKLTVTHIRGGKKKTIHLIQNKGERKGRPHYEWSNSKGKILSRGIVTRLESLCKQLRIYMFQDDLRLKDVGKPDLLWKSAKDEVIVEVSINGGKSYTIHLKNPSKEIKINKYELVLLRTSLEKTIDFSQKRLMDGIIRQMKRVEIDSKRIKRARKPRRPIIRRRPPVLPKKRKSRK